MKCCECDSWLPSSYLPTSSPILFCTQLSNFVTNEWALYAGVLLLHQAEKTCLEQTLWLIRHICQLRRKLTVVNMTPVSHHHIFPPSSKPSLANNPVASLALNTYQRPQPSIFIVQILSPKQSRKFVVLGKKLFQGQCILEQSPGAKFPP